MTNPIYTSSQKAKIKSFRHNISVLKRKGLVSKKIDARSIKPSSHYQSIIKNFKSVLEGTATAVKLPKSLRQQYKNVGYKGAFEKVIIPHRKDEKVIVTHGQPKTTNSNGIIKMDIPIEFHNIEQYLRDLKKKRPKKKENERFGFRFYGNNSRHTYDDFDEMIAELQKYTSILDAQANLNPADAQEIIEGLTWYKIGNRKLWKEHREKMKHEKQMEKQRIRRARYKARMSESPTQNHLNFLKKDREYSKLKYNRMSDEQKEKRKKQMREYYKKTKGKK